MLYWSCECGKRKHSRRKGKALTLQQELELLRAENVKLKAGSSKDLSMKISEKRALSVYGLGRFPVTLYKEQWRRLIAFAKEIEKFLNENDALLKTKGEE